MGEATHFVIIGNGMAGNQAASVLRSRDSGSRITIISAGPLLFYNRYDLPDVFRGRESWMDFLVHPPHYYERNRIVVRRRSEVVEVDATKQTLVLAHREEVSYDYLLVATGGESYVPEQLSEARHLMHFFNSFRAAMATRAALPGGGRAIMLGGDSIGLDLARTLIDSGHHVTLVTDEHTFWPHAVPLDQRPRYYEALEKMGIEVLNGAKPERIEQGAAGMPARRVHFDDGRELRGDIVMPFYGLVPNVDFMSTSGVDLERGILVNARLGSSVENIWAAGDVCQIWVPESNCYRFYYGYRNVRRMGDVAARNMAGDEVPFTSSMDDERLELDASGHIYSAFWEHD